MKKLTDKIRENAPIHGGIPFWSWNDKLEEDELRRQIRNMKELGMRGFFMHARGGLETEYMSDEWFKAIEICIDEAKKLGMEAWAYDENGWPSGFAGGALLDDPRNFAKSVIMKESDSFPAPDEDILGVYTVNGTKLTKVDSECGAEKYYIIVREHDFSYVDTMDEEVTEKFIKLTHEVYKEKLKDKGFGKEMPGFFTDEPQYFRWGTQWSDTFLVNFKKRFGYDVLEGLPHLFIDGLDGGFEYRYDYYLICHEQFYSGFMKKIYDWCDENGVKLTGHAVEEWGLSGQMWCCGGAMPFYLYEHIPGVDYLCRQVKDISGAKQLGSVCEQTGKKVSMTESYACCGWDVSPRELKRITDVQFAGGVNLVCGHLYAYSERGQRKRDYPNHYSDHTPWQKYFSAFERLFQRLGAALSEGKEAADTLVIHPIRSAYLHWPRNMSSLENNFSNTTEMLTNDHVSFHYGDETVMRLYGKVEGDKIRVGECVYDKVLLPYIETVDGSTRALLEEYISNGGKVTVLGDAPTRVDGRISDLSFIKENLPYSELVKQSGITVTNNGKNAPLHMQMRDTENGRLIFVANTTMIDFPNTEITVPSVSGLAELDLDTLEYRPVRGRKNDDGSVTVLYDFYDSASCILVESDIKMLDMIKTEEKPTVSLGDFTLDTLPENVMLLDKACISKDGGEFTEERPIVRIKDNLLKERFEGSLSLKFSFDAETFPKTAYLAVEPLRYTEMTVNGTPVGFTEGWRIDRCFKLIDIAKLIKLGRNDVILTLDYYQSEYVYKVLYGGGNEALRNCLCFDTEIENVYLYGDFGVYSRSPFIHEKGKENYDAFGIEPQNGSTPPILVDTCRCDGPYYIAERSSDINLTDIVSCGYTFFAGELTASTIISYKQGDPTFLKLGGRFLVCRAVINGTDLGARLFTDSFELAPYLKEGENKLTLTLCFSNRNLLGPHNRSNPEPLGVSPNTFSFEKEWDGDKCDGYVDAKAFVRFGIGF